MSDEDIQSFRRLVRDSGVGEHVSAVLLDLCEYLPANGQWNDVPALGFICADLAARQAQRLRAETAAARAFIRDHEQDCWLRQGAHSARQAVAWLLLNRTSRPDHPWNTSLADDLVFTVARLIRRTSRYELCRECTGLRNSGSPLLASHKPLCYFWSTDPIDSTRCVHRFRGNAWRARRAQQAQAALADWSSRQSSPHD
jgi:hypothetical protein